MKKARLREIKDCLLAGGMLRYDWKSGVALLIWPNKIFQDIDGRSYSGFLQSVGEHPPSWVSRIESGTVEAKDLVITWRLNVKRPPDHSASLPA